MCLGGSRKEGHPSWGEVGEVGGGILGGAQRSKYAMGGFKERGGPRVEKRRSTTFNRVREIRPMRSPREEESSSRAAKRAKNLTRPPDKGAHQGGKIGGEDEQ